MMKNTFDLKIEKLKKSNQPNAINLLKKIEPELRSLERKSPRRLAEIRLKLNDLANEWSGDKGYYIISDVIAIVKGYGEGKIKNQHWSKPASVKHIMSDHALCSYLSRYEGWDINALKDAAMESIERQGIKQVKSKAGYIITVLPEV